MAREGIVSSKGHHARTRMFPGVPGRRPDNKKARVAEAKERQEAWAKLSPQEQLKALDRRPGGSVKQRARLAANIERAKNPPPKVKQAKPVEAVTDGTGERLKAKERRTQERSKRPGADKRDA